MNRFTQYAIVIVLAAGAIITQTIGGTPTGWDFVSFVLAIAAGVFGQKWRFGRL